MIDAVLEDRFWRKVQRTPDSCWEWLAARRWKKKNRKYGDRSNWYGAFKVPGGTVESHRFAWESAEGPIPPGLHVLHRCDNPGCVRPSHLFLGTNADNIADRKAKGRPAPGIQPKLTPDQVRAVRASTMKQRDIAKQYGMSQASIWACRARQTYSDIE